MGPDLTYIRTWSGWVYVAFVLDVYSRMIVGWQLATHMRTDLPLEALEMALWRRGIKKGAGPDSSQRPRLQPGLNRSSQHRLLESRTAVTVRAAIDRLVKDGSVLESEPWRALDVLAAREY